MELRAAADTGVGRPEEVLTHPDPRAPPTSSPSPQSTSAYMRGGGLAETKSPTQPYNPVSDPGLAWLQETHFDFCNNIHYSFLNFLSRFHVSQ